MPFGPPGVCPGTLLPDPMNASPDEIRAAIDTAVAAGFDTASLWAFQLGPLGGGETAAAWLRSAGMRTRAVEAAVSWPSGDDATVRAEAESIAEAAGVLGADLVMAVCMDPVLDDIERARDNLAVVVAAATAAGARTCVEFLPWSGIPDLATAWALVEPLGPDAGLIVDGWHWQRQPGGPQPELLRSIPGERLMYLQLCDAAPGTGRDMEEAMSGRLLPGDGVVDFPQLVGIFQEAGANPFVATEVFNPGLLQQLGQRSFAEACLQRGRAVLAGAESRS